MVAAVNSLDSTCPDEGVDLERRSLVSICAGQEASLRVTESANTHSFTQPNTDLEDYETSTDQRGSDSLYSNVSLVSEGPRQSDLATRAAEAEAENSRENTIAAYASDRKPWLVFCSQEKIDPLGPSEEVLILYAQWLAEGGYLIPLAPESIRRRLTGVLSEWNAHHVNYSRGVTKRARQWIAGYETRLVQEGKPTGRGHAHHVAVSALRVISEHCLDTLPGRRDAAVVLLGFAIGARRSELSFLDVRDVTASDEGLYVHVRRSKSGVRRPPVPRGHNEMTCPVRAWERWHEALGQDGAAFRRIDRHHNIGGRLSPAGIGSIVTRAAERAGIDARLTGHSLRSGFATEARRAGHPVELIADQGGWSRTSTVLHRYIRRVDEWTNNPLEGIGL